MHVIDRRRGEEQPKGVSTPTAKHLKFEIALGRVTAFNSYRKVGEISLSRYLLLKRMYFASKRTRKPAADPGR